MISMSHGHRDRIRSPSSVAILMALVALLALNFLAMRPASALIHGLGHWLGAILLQVGLISAIRRRRISPAAFGRQAGGWAYLLARALSAPPKDYWWEYEIARSLRIKEMAAGAAAWGADRWYVEQANLEFVHLAFMGLTASANGLILGQLARVVGGRSPLTRTGGAGPAS